MLHIFSRRFSHIFGKLKTAFNIAEKKEVPFFPGNEETFLSCAFSLNGKRLVTSDGSNIIKLWDVAKQRLLLLLCAGFSVDWWCFSIPRLFIIANPKFEMEKLSWLRYLRSDLDFSFCVWNAITLQRSDKRELSLVKWEKPRVLKSKKCERCFQRGFQESLYFQEFTIWERFQIGLVVSCAWICKGVECIFFPKEFYNSSVIESISLIVLAAESCFNYDYEQLVKMTALKNNLWLYADSKKLIVLKALAPTQKQSSLSYPTKVYSSSFSSDGSRLASCTSDGYIKVWNVYTNQVEQSFKSNEGGSSFFCWWSENFLFVIGGSHEIPRLTQYLVDINSEILFTHSQEVSLGHLLTGPEL